jgi:hypothetical protein
MQAGKGNTQYPLDAAFIATSNVSFVAGKASVTFSTTYDNVFNRA